MSKQLRIWLFVLLGTLLASSSLLAEGVITMTTYKAVGKTIALNIKANGNISIEGVRKTGRYGKELYRLSSQTVTIRGDVTTLSCNGNLLTSLNVSGCTALTALGCYNNQLTSLDVSKNTSLTTLECYRNQLTSVNVSGCTTLTTLNCWDNKLTSLNLSGCTALTRLDCADNQLTALDVSKNTALTSLGCYRNRLTALDVSKNTALRSLFCHINQLTSLDVSQNTALIWLLCYNNQLTALDVSQNTALTRLDCHGNQIKGEEMTRLVNSLPDRNGKYAGKFTVVQGPAPEGNICLKSDVAIAKGKNWNTLKFRFDINEDVAYEGAQTLKVTLTKEGEGTLTAPGAEDLNAVPEGTELTIVATPADGYKLTALTANGKDILATKKFVVTENTEIKATFAKKKNYTVTFTPEGEGTLTATRNGEPFTSGSLAYEDDKIVITAQPAEGYQIDKWLIGKEEIEVTLYTGKTTFECTVGTADVLIKATFTKKTFAVTITKEGEGTISASGADDLNAVPYGTELTIEATPAEGYKLTALTANGTDILATKKVVIKGATEVKATFVDHTGVETTVTQQVKLYPNPATDYVIVEGVAPASEVTLHSLTGERLYAGRADSRGTLQIDLTPYADGVYLVCVAGETYRVVVRR